MISLLAKYPWHSVANYKLSDRTKIFNAARQILSILSATIRHHVYNPQPRPASDLYGNPIAYGLVGRRGSISHGGGGALGLPPIMLNEELLHDLLSAGLNAVGFSERQRYELYEICDYARHHFIVSPLLQYWPFEVLCRKPRAEEDVIEVSHSPLPPPPPSSPSPLHIQSPLTISCIYSSTPTSYPTTRKSNRPATPSAA